MNKEVEITVTGFRPAPWAAPDICFSRNQSKRTGRRARFVKYRGKSNRAKGILNFPDWKKEVARCARGAWGEREPLGGPLRLHITFVFPHDTQDEGSLAWLPMKWDAKKKKFKKPYLNGRTLPDITNLFKSTEDALHGIVLHDDVQVVMTSSSREWGSQGGCQIKVYSLDYTTIEAQEETPAGHVGTQQQSDAGRDMRGGRRSRRVDPSR